MILVVGLQVHPHLAPQLDRLHAADVGTAFFPFSFQQLHEHPLAAAGVRSHPELHRLHGPDLLFRDIQVPGVYHQMVLGAAMLPLAANGDRPVKPAVDQLADVGLPQFQGLIELQQRALGRFQHDRLPDPLLGAEVRVLGRVDHHARIDLHAAVAEIGVVAAATASPGRSRASWHFLAGADAGGKSGASDRSRLAGSLRARSRSGCEGPPPDCRRTAGSISGTATSA